MSLVKWSDEMSVQVPELDNQHKKLIDLLNQLHDAMANRRAKEVAGPIIKELIMYTVAHFRTEEQYMQRCAYADLENHQALHGRLTVEGHDPDVGRLAEAIRPDALLRLGFASSYLRLLESALADTTDGRIPDRRRALERLAAANVERYREGLNEMPELLLEMTHDMEPRR